MIPILFVCLFISYSSCVYAKEKTSSKDKISLYMNLDKDKISHPNLHVKRAALNKVCHESFNVGEAFRIVGVDATGKKYEERFFDFKDVNKYVPTYPPGRADVHSVPEKVSYLEVCIYLKDNPLITNVQVYKGDLLLGEKPVENF